MVSDKALLNTLQLFSPSLPIGAFAFSQGLEAAITSGQVADAVALETWCGSVLRDSLQTLDCHYLRQAHQVKNTVEWSCINEQLLAYRETAELCRKTYYLAYLLVSGRTSGV